MKAVFLEERAMNQDPISTETVPETLRRVLGKHKHCLAAAAFAAAGLVALSIVWPWLMQVVLQ